MHRSIVFSLSLLLAASTGWAQTPERPAPRQRSESAARQIERKQVRRQLAIAGLDSAIDELSKLDDLSAKLSIAEDLVKGLARIEPDRCRKLLDSLFDEAKHLQEGSSAAAGPGSNADAIIQRIVRLAGSFDAKLAESYIDEYARDESGRAEDLSAKANNAKAAALRLRIATDLIEASPVSSVQVAESSLAIGIFPETLVFLGHLKRKDAGLANSFFKDSLLSITRRNGNDVNELLLLYAYVFSPLRVPVVTPNGLGVFSIPAYRDVAEQSPIEPGPARLFLDTTARLVLDQNRMNPERRRFLVNGPEGDYYLIDIVQPAAANYAPALSDPLAVHKTILAAMLQPDTREATTSAADRWNRAPAADSSGGGNAQTVDYLLERAEKTSDPARKDRLYFQAASAAVDAKDYDRALEIVDKLSGSYSGDAKLFIKFHIALNAVRNHDVEKAEFYARHDDDLARRAFVLTTIAANSLDGKSADPERAKGLLEEVQELAARLKKEDEKPPVLFGIVSVYSRFDSAQASQSLELAFQAANKVEDFGRNPRIIRGLEIGGFLFDYSMYGDQFTFLEGLKRLGLKEPEETLSRIRILTSRFARLKATVIVCNAVLAES